MQNRANVLVIEDSVTQAVALQDLLETQGWNVTVASSAEAALTAMGERVPDLIITDYHLPGLRGDELCRRLRLKLSTRGVPIIMLTAEGDGEVAGIDSGADLYLAKPVDAETFVARARALLDRSVGESIANFNSGSDFSNSRILAIDDSLTYLEYLKVLLTEEGYVVDAVSSGEAGLQKLEAHDYDCILVDLVMPGLDGIEVCKRVLSTQSAVEDPVVMLMLTAHETKEEVTRGLAAGADDFVSKHSDVAVLKARIRALLRRKFLQTENKRIIEELKNRELEAVRARAEREITQARNLMIEQLERTAVDLKHSNDELTKTREIALQASASKSEFLANMSHEIRTPINGVIGMTDLLLDLPLDVTQRDYVETIKRSADSLLAIVNDILDFSKIEAGRLDTEEIDFDVVQAMQDLVKTFAPMARKQGVDLSAEIAPDLPRFVKGDPGRLRQILTNLINNALKFTRQGGVTLIARTEADRNGQKTFRFEVRDTGIGISPSGRERLFQAFSQVDSSTSRRYGGTGLGLAISKRLVALMEGGIGVNSTEGVGSTFWFTLPLKVGDQRSVESGHDILDLSDVGRRFAGKNVLIAEDNPINQKVALLMMRKLGLNAVAVNDGREALAALAAAPYDVVLMDCHMPGLDGYEATRAIRQMANAGLSAIPIIAMTANALAGEREKCIAAGMDDYVAKPVRIDALAAKLADALRVDLARSAGAPAPTPSASDRAALNADTLDGLAALEGDDPERLKELIAMFVTDTEQRLTRLDAAARADRVADLLAEAHGLKSSCAYVGAVGMADLCERLEALRGATPDAGFVGWADSLRAEFARVRAALYAHQTRVTSAARSA